MYEWKSDSGVWVANEWRHVVWTLSRQADGAAEWRIYIDGQLEVNVTKVFPDDGTLLSNVIGASNIGRLSPFYGYMDTVEVFPVALTDSEAKRLYMVILFSLCTCVYICTCADTYYVYIYIYILIYTLARVYIYIYIYM